MGRNVITETNHPTNEVLGLVSSQGSAHTNTDADTLQGVSSSNLVPSGEVGKALLDALPTIEYIAIPTITSHTGGATLGVGPLVGNPMPWSNYCVPRHNHSIWQISTSLSAFDANIVETSGVSISNLTTYYPRTLSPSTSYYARVRYLTGNLQSRWSTIIEFTTSTGYSQLGSPVISSGYGFSNTPTSLVFTSSPIDIITGSPTLVSSVWSVYEIIDYLNYTFYNPVHTVTHTVASGTDNLYAMEVPENALNLNTRYLITVKYLTTTGETVISSKVFKTRSEIMQWQSQDMCPVPVKDASCCTLPLSGRVVLLGGIDDSGNVSDDAYISNPNGMGWVKFLTSTHIRQGTRVTSYMDGWSEVVMFCGGGSPVVNTAHIFTFPTAGDLTGTLTQIANVPSNRRNHGLVTMSNNDIILTGGHSGSIYSTRTYRYVPFTNTWTLLTADLDLGLESMGISVIPGNRIMITGGNRSGNDTDKVLVLDMDDVAGGWKVSGTDHAVVLPEGTGRHTQVTLNDGRVMVFVNGITDPGRRVITLNSHDLSKPYVTRGIYPRRYTTEAPGFVSCITKQGNPLLLTGSSFEGNPLREVYSLTV